MNTCLSSARHPQPRRGRVRPVTTFGLTLAALLTATTFGATAAWATPPNPPSRTQRLTDPEALPAGLSATAWASIRSQIAAQRHAVTATAEGHQAVNPGQQWRTRFDGRAFVVEPPGADWRWGLALAGYGRSGALQTVGGQPEARAEGARLTYHWGVGLEEWFINDRRGLEHGFTVQSRPAGGDAPLELVLAVQGGLRPEVQAGATGVHFLEGQGRAVVTYTGLLVTDADGRIVPAHFAPVTAHAATQLTLRVEDRGARYPLTIDPLAQQAYLKPSNTQAGDYFGWSVAVSGDTVVVGAYGEDSNAAGVDGNQSDNSASYAGAAYVFVRSGTAWSQQAYLKASNAGANDRFGYAVAVSGDTVVVGAYGEGSNATGVNGDEGNNDALNSGAAYVFVRSGTTWSQQAYLKASNAEPGDSFGASVAVAGDTVAVGAYGEASNATGVNGDQGNNDAPNAGAAYVFARSGTTWSQQAYLKASNAEEYDFFGYAVAVAGDTVVVGAEGEGSSATGVNGDQSNNDALGAGAAYVFVRNGSAWSQQAYVKAANAGEGDAFGTAVAVSANTLVAGASGEASNATGVNGQQGNNSAGDSGAAYVFVRSGITWSQQAYLKASNTQAGDHFGYSVAASGDTVVVGAYGEDSNAIGVNGNQSDNSASASGAAYLFTRSGTTWSQQGYLKAANTGNNDFFGSVALSGDTVVVGAYGEDGSATGVNGSNNHNAADAGAAYMFTFSPDSAPTDLSLSPASVSENQPGGTPVGTLSATAPNPGGTFTYTLVAGAGADDNAAFSISGDQLRTAALFDYEVKSSYTVRIRTTDQGGLYFEKPFTITINDVNEPPTALALAPASVDENQPSGTPVGTLSTTDPDAGNTFTYTLVAGVGADDNAAFAISGSALQTAAVFNYAAKHNYTVRVRTTDQGGLYFEQPFAVTANPAALDAFAQQAYLKASNTGVGDYFGWSVAVSGDTMVVGAYGEDSSALGVNGNQDDDTASYAGAAYIFVRSGTAWSQQAYLKALNTGANDRFGYSVAVSGDTVVVGAPSEASNATGVDGDGNSDDAPTAGAAYVFVRQGTTWSQQAYLKASNTKAGDSFGASVAVSGDTVVVGAHAESSRATGVDGDASNNDSPNAGAAYVFVRSGTTWNQQAYLKASNTEAGDSFGISVAVSGNTVAIGAESEGSHATGINGSQSNNDALNAGAVYVFVRSGIAWSQQAYLKASNTGAGDAFGTSVAVVDDTLVIGAAGEASNASGVNGNQSDNSAGGSGAAYVFLRSGTAWSQQAYLKASNSQAGDRFGYSVAVSGDRVLVGADGEDSHATGVNGNQSANSASASGAAYIFERSGTAWSQRAYLKAANTDINDFFGSVAVSADTVLVGAYGEDGSATGVNSGDNNAAADAGAAYGFTLAPESVPTALGLVPASVDENLPSGTAVGTLSAIGPDPSSTFTFTLVAGLGDDDNPAFLISGSTVQTAAVFDFESKPLYTTRIRATDQHGLYFEQQFDVAVNAVNESPTALDVVPASVDENQTPGTTVGTLSTTDPDAGNTFTYTLVTGAGADDNAAFGISGGTLQTAVVFDYEAKSSYTIRVRTTDQGGLYFEQQFIIAINDVNEPPTALSLAPASGDENQPIGTPVGTLSTMDPDAGNSFTYTLVAGAGADDNAAFAISGSTLQTAAMFNYEVQSSYTLRVRTTDQGGLYFEQQFTVTLNDLYDDVTMTCPPASTGLPCDGAVPPPYADWAAFVLAGGDATAELGGTLTLIHVSDVASGSCPKTITRTYRVTDAFGNTATCAQAFTVVDTFTPVVTVSQGADATIDCPTAPSFAAPVFADACGGEVTPTVVTITNLSGFTNVITRTWTATSGCGQSTNRSQTVYVVDTTPPELICAGPRTNEFTAAWTFDVPTATDNCPGTVTLAELTTVTNLGCGATYTATRTWSATDAVGNSNLCSQTVYVLDITPPQLIGLLDKVVACGDAWDFDPPLARDEVVFDTLIYDNTLYNLDTRFNSGTNEIGDEIILAGAERLARRFSFEYWGVNSAQAEFEGNVQVRLRFYRNDGPPPTGAATPGTVLFDSGPFPIPAYERALLTYDDFIADAVVPLLQELPNHFTWTVEFSGLAPRDRAGVVIYSPPTVGNNYRDFWLRDQGAWSLRYLPTLPVDFSARLEASRSLTVTPVSTVTNTACGSTFSATRLWSATDACGNGGNWTQVVTVTDSTPPVLTGVPDDLTVACGAVPAPQAVTASDNCGAAPAVSYVEVTLPGGTAATYQLQRTWSATDECGNSTTRQQVITVQGCAAIGNLVWADWNNNGRVDPGEPGLPNVSVELWRDLNTDGVFDPSGADLQTSRTTTTDASGGYGFSNLLAGAYFVVIPVPPVNHALSSTHTTAVDNGVDNDDNGLQPGGPGTLTVSPAILLSAGETDNTVDFGFMDPGIGNLVWLDKNGNGRVDAGEPGLSNVVVQLYGTNALDGTTYPSFQLLLETTTDADGYYLFTALASGSYFVRIPAANFAPGGPLRPYRPTSPAVNLDNQVDDDSNGIQAVPGGDVDSPLIQLTTAQEPTDAGTETGRGRELDNAADPDAELTVDFGFSYPQGVAGYVFNDLTRDGVWNPANDLPLTNILVYVTNSEGVVESASTDSTGFFHVATPPGSTHLLVDTNSPSFPTGLVLADNTFGQGQNPSTVTVLPDNFVQRNTGYRRTSPTLASLLSLTAHAEAGPVTVRWVTLAEIGTVAYDLQRELPDGVWTTVNADPVFAWNSILGASYDVPDAEVRARGHYRYQLLEYQDSGSTTLHGPYSVTVSGEPGLPVPLTAVLRRNGQLRLTWPVETGANYLLERNRSLGPEADWAEVPLPASAQGRALVTREGMTGYFRVFRLP